MNEYLGGTIFIECFLMPQVDRRAIELFFRLQSRTLLDNMFIEHGQFNWKGSFPPVGRLVHFPDNAHCT